MREIEFKGKSLENEWVYGDLVRNRIWATLIEYKIDGQHHLTAINPDTLCEYINYKDINEEKLYTGDIVYYHRHEGSYTESNVLYKLGVIAFDDKALGYRIKPIDTHSDKINYGVDGEKIKTSHRVIKVGDIFDYDIQELVKTYLKNKV